MNLAGNASTNSRGHRPLPPGALNAVTLWVDGVYEGVEFEYPDGKFIAKHLLSWVGGQSGLLWGGGPYPLEIRDTIKHHLHNIQGSYGHECEWELANALGAALDGVFTSDKLSCRFFQSGGEALAAAARLARHKTGRDYLTSYGYHGAAEEWAHNPGKAGILPGAIDYHRRIEWGDDVTQHAQFSAAICVEVPAVPDNEARTFLQACRQACDDNGAIFILDEVVTGFRLGLQGAAGYYGVKPDIACYGKAMSATGCVSAVVGRADLVDAIGGDVFYSTTFGGSPGPCAVAAATVKYLTAHAVEEYVNLFNIGNKLKFGLIDLGIPVVGQPERSALAFKTDADWLAFCSAMIERGVMMHRPQFPTLNHTEADVARTLEAAADVQRAAQTDFEMAI